MLQELIFLKIRKQFNALRIEMMDLLAQKFPHDPSLYIREACYGGIKSYDAFVLNRLLYRYRPQAILEIGCFIGLSSRWILESTAAWKPKLVAVDPNIPHRVFEEPQQIYQEFTAKKFPDRLEYHEAFFSDGALDNDLTRHFPHKAKFWVPAEGQTFDFIFVDAGHSYEEVKHDYQLALRYIKKSGVIVFHDALTWPGVAQLTQEIGAKIYQPWWYKRWQAFFNQRGWFIDGVASIQIH